MWRERNNGRVRGKRETRRERGKRESEMGVKVMMGERKERVVERDKV